MKEKRPQTLWRWLCLRILTLAIGTVVLIALCMWLRFTVQYLWITHHMPPEVLQAFEALREHPERDPARYHAIVDRWWGIRYTDPSIASSDWITVGILVMVTIPFIVYFGLRHARPLSQQFSALRHAADAVTAGRFDARSALITAAPAEVQHFAADFNSMTQQLAHYERELRASHVAMAHELRSPLTAAIGRLQGLIDGVFEPDPRHHHLIMSQLRYLSRLIDDLHLLSLADAGQLILEPAACDAAELLRERIAWLKPQLDSAAITVTLNVADRGTLCADAFRLGQVFTILLENTLRYAGPGTALNISLRRQATHWVMAFEDTGPGVAPDFLSAMFERFSRGDTSRARHSGGSGLGLSIARAICRAHGGDICASLPAGGGLCLRITLPAR